MERIKAIIVKIIIKIIGKDSLTFHLKLSDRCREILDLNGYENSIKKGLPVNISGNPYPWFTYPLINFLEQFNFTDKKIFEWGSGNSSLYFAAKCFSIISIESSAKWFQHVKDNKLQNQEILLRNNKEYVNSIEEFDQSFDVIIIDADFRIECAKKAPSKLNKGGLIVLDNSDWFPEACEILRNAGLIQIDFYGFGPINTYTWCSSIFFDEHFQFKTLQTRQPTFAIGGLKKEFYEVKNQEIR